MKIPKLELILALPVGRVTMDAQSTTTLRVNGVDPFHPIPTDPYGDTFQDAEEGDIPLLRIGDRLAFTTRHAAFTGRVIGVQTPTAEEISAAQAHAACFGGPQPATSTVRYTLTGGFEGREGALLGGRTAIGGYRANVGPDTLVSTSAWGHPVRWADYQDAKSWSRSQGRGVTHEFPIPGGQAEWFRRGMREYLAIVARGGLKPWIPQALPA